VKDRRGGEGSQGWTEREGNVREERESRDEGGKYADR